MHDDVLERIKYRGWFVSWANTCSKVDNSYRQVGWDTALTFYAKKRIGCIVQHGDIAKND